MNNLLLRIASSNVVAKFVLKINVFQSAERNRFDEQLVAADASSNVVAKFVLKINLFQRAKRNRFGEQLVATDCLQQCCSNVCFENKRISES